MLKCRMSPSPSDASGSKAYGVSCRTIGCGVPLIVGTEFFTAGGSPEPGLGEPSVPEPGGSCTEPPDDGGVPGDGLPVTGGVPAVGSVAPGPSSPPQAARMNDEVIRTSESFALRRLIPICKRPPC